MGGARGRQRRQQTRKYTNKNKNQTNKNNESEKNKTQIPKVMFLAAVGFPRPDHSFNGQI